MTEVTWTEIRAIAIGKFNDQLPSAETEFAIVEVFEQLPAVVLAAIDKIGAKVASGAVHSGWAILQRELEGAASRSAATVTLDDDKGRITAMAERWIYNAGLYCDRCEEVESALFGDSGGFDDKGHSLRAWHEDETLVTRLRGLWEKSRPRGERSEAEHEERMRDGKERRKRLVA